MPGTSLKYAALHTLCSVFFVMRWHLCLERQIPLIYHPTVLCITHSLKVFGGYFDLFLPELQWKPAVYCLKATIRCLIVRLKGTQFWQLNKRFGPSSGNNVKESLFETSTTWIVLLCCCWWYDCKWSRFGFFNETSNLEMVTMVFGRFWFSLLSYMLLAKRLIET